VCVSVSVCERKSASENKRREPLKSYTECERVQKSVFIVTVTPARAVLMDVGNFHGFLFIMVLESICSVALFYIFALAFGPLVGAV
jgi:hypothetical protein